MIRIDMLTPITVARHNDGAADVIAFDLRPWRTLYPELTAYRVEAQSPDGVVYLPAAVTQCGDVLYWTIMPGDTATEGSGLYQIVATGSDGRQKTSAHAPFVVRPVIAGTAQENPPEPSQPWVDRVLEASAAAEEAAAAAEVAAGKASQASVSPPVIGENGSWLVWDFEAGAYVDSGVRAQGPQGVQGEQGPQGETGVPPVAAYSGTLAVNTVYTAELTGAVAFALPTPADLAHENRIRMLASVAADTAIDWGTTTYYGAAVPYITEGFFEIIWDYNPLIGAWVAGATRIGQVVSV